MINFNEIKNKIPEFTSIKLCEMIVAGRYFTFYSELVSICMEELSHRRSNGDQFMFEEYIENISKELPQFNFEKNKDIRDILSKALK